MTVYPGRRSYIPDTSHVWNLCNEEVTPTDDYTHFAPMEIIRSDGKLTPDVLISERLQLARRTRYALMGAWLHGSNGISPVVAWSMYKTHVVPRLLLNLEVIPLTASQVAQLEQFHRTTLRSLQGLPDHTSSAATYLLLGALPIVATLHISILLLFGRIAKGDTRGGGTHIYAQYRYVPQ